MCQIFFLFKFFFEILIFIIKYYNFNTLLFYFLLLQTNGTFYKKYLPLLDDFIKSNRSKVPGNTTLTSYATLMYDSLWTIGIALNRTETVLKTKGYSLTDFTYKGTSVHSWSNISNILASKMQETDFLGVSVSEVLFTSKE